MLTLLPPLPLLLPHYCCCRCFYIRVLQVMQECGGEPAAQVWTYNASGLGEIRNRNQCLNVANCDKEIIYDGCSPKQPFGCGNNEAFFYEPSTHRLISKVGTGAEMGLAVGAMQMVLCG